MPAEQKKEEILQALWEAEEHGESTLQSIRAHCPEEVSEAEIARLEEQGLLRREGDLIIFTADGKARAQTVVRRYRLTLSLLTHVLQLPQEQAEQIACDMEHILPTEMTQSICTLLGHPEVTPDGRPIPSGDDCQRHDRSVAAVIVNLCDLAPGERGRIAYIKPKNHSRTHRLASFGVVPGVVVELHQKYPAFCIKFEGTELALSKDVAEDIYVGRVSGRDDTPGGA